MVKTPHQVRRPDAALPADRPPTASQQRRLVRALLVQRAAPLNGYANGSARLKTCAGPHMTSADIAVDRQGYNVEQQSSELYCGHYIAAARCRPWPGTEWRAVAVAGVLLSGSAGGRRSDPGLSQQELRPVLLTCIRVNDERTSLGQNRAMRHGGQHPMSRVPSGRRKDSPAPINGLGQGLRLTRGGRLLLKSGPLPG